jgi:hypothetical protein
MQYQIDFLDGSNVVVCELRAFAGSPADALLGLVGNIEWPTGAVACVLDGPGRILTVSRRFVVQRADQLAELGGSHDADRRHQPRIVRASSARSLSTLRELRDQRRCGQDEFLTSASCG